ncbi:MAG TPA: M20/M25/M40 family metallo-hydrolase, partial [Fibrobacteraceae bacterium]|nr:M20/M25/M40 family metallo-hydrolase [Fibrobacteraceae bacterium]
MLDGVRLLVEPSDLPVALWRRPSLTVTTIAAGDRKAAGNVLQASAYARLGVRLAPGMDWQKSVRLLTSFLQERCPWGLQVEIRPELGANAWMTSMNHPAFQRMREALEQGYGRPARIVGCGASIPGAPLFPSIFGEIPVLLTGLKDPVANAHGENESLDLEDFRKAILSEAGFLYRMGGSA